MTYKPIETYPRVAVVQKIDDREIGWLKPFAHVAEHYYRELPLDTYGEWGSEYLALVALKGSEVQVGDSFQSWNPETDIGENGLSIKPIVGAYVPDLEELI